MRKLIFLPFFVWLCTTGFCKPGNKRQHVLRTDGFYYYDNNIDTFAVTKDSKDLFFMVLASNGGKLPPHRFTNSCGYDSIVVLKGASSLYQMIAFFSDSTGTAIENGCRDNIMDCIQVIKARRSGHDTDAFAANDRIYNMIVLDEHTAAFDVSGHDLAARYSVNIENDSLVATVHQKNYPTIPTDFPRRVYHFIPYDKVPPDLGRIRTR